jgi:hypothetical protein
MAFSTKKMYDEFMYQELGEKYFRHEEAISHLRDYAIESGAVAHYESTGEALQSYLDYEKKYLTKMFPEDMEANNQKTIIAILFKKTFCQKAFNIALPLLGTPFFIFNNNKASAMEGLLIGGHHKSFDNAFYQNQLFTLNTWGFHCRNFPAFLENRTSSWWNIGV